MIQKRGIMVALYGYYGYGYYYDPMYILIIISCVIAVSYTHLTLPTTERV